MSDLGFQLPPGTRVYRPGGPVGVDPESPSIHLRDDEMRAFGIRLGDPLHSITVEAFGPGDGDAERVWRDRLAAIRAEQLRAMQAEGGVRLVEAVGHFVDEVPLP